VAEPAGPDSPTPADGLEAFDGLETGGAAHGLEAADGGDDDRNPSGPRRVLIALYAIFALAATARAVVQLTTQYSAAPLAYLLSLFSGVVYIAATVGLVTNRSWSRPLAWAACGTELVGVMVIGIASIVDSAAFPHDTVWSRFGSGYGFIPLVLPLLGLSWLWQTRPAESRNGPAADPVR
jgi:hypothetical protein